MKNKKTTYIVVVVILMLISTLIYQTVYANDERNPDHFITVDKDGNFKEMSMAELESKTANEIKNRQRRTRSIQKDIAVGVVNFKTKASSSLNTNYTNVETGAVGYTNGYYGSDGAFLGYNQDKSKVKFMLSGVTGWVNTSEVEILDYNDKIVKSVNFYRVENGRIYHYGTNDIKQGYYWLVNDIGPQQSYLKSNTVYYSYDGHYFYTTYETMINDYKSNNRNNSVNKIVPYYNYFQYLSHRSKTNFTAKDFNDFLASKTDVNKSKMKNLGDTFIEYQNKYGANAVLAYGVAINESGYGNSEIALNKNNLFGHGATDTNPYYGANGYSSPSDSVKYHAEHFVSIGYLDACDGKDTKGNGYNPAICLRGRYFGPHLGDKNSGMNVKYASDPYWGEKAARVGWELEKTKQYQNIDNQKYQLAIKENNFILNIRNKPTSSSNLLYQTVQNSTIPFLILEEVQGDTVNGSTLWYKIQTDSVLDAFGNKLIQDVGTYSFATNIGYIHSSLVAKVGSSNIPLPPPPPEVNNLAGDVNLDGKLSASDYLMIKDYIMGTLKLNEKQQNNADVNKDNKTTSADYLMIRDIIMKK